MSQAQIKLLLVDDHEVVRLGLKALFQTVPYFAVVGEAGTSAEAIRLARRCQPDVVVMDIRLPDSNGVDTCRAIRSELPRTRVLMLTSYADEDALISSIVAGAAGYLLKEASPQQLVDAVVEIGRGGSLLDPGVTRTMLQWVRRVSRQVASDPLTTVSEQERNILPLIADGKTNREIAAALYLSEHTVKDYVSSILAKLQLARRAEIAAFLARRQKQTEP